jgi:hypothetical protein
MDSEWWDRPAYEPCLRHRSGLLGDVEYEYVVEVYSPQHVPNWVPPPPPEEVVLPVEEYQHPNLSEEEAI